MRFEFLALVRGRFWLWGPIESLCTPRETGLGGRGHFRSETWCPNISKYNPHLYYLPRLLPILGYSDSDIPLVWAAPGRRRRHALVRYLPVHNKLHWRTVTCQCMY